MGEMITRETRFRIGNLVLMTRHNGCAPEIEVHQFFVQCNTSPAGYRKWIELGSIVLRAKTDHKPSGVEIANKLLQDLEVITTGNQFDHVNAFVNEPGSHFFTVSLKVGEIPPGIIQ